MQSLRNNYRILFIGKRDDEYSKQAASFLEAGFPDTQVVFSRRTDTFPEELLEWNGDIIISYLSQWIIPQLLLDKAAVAAINFHPGPPEYPGIGCTNFAIYNGEKVFGVTCHYMKAQVDTGEIIRVSRFPILPEDTVYTLTQHCYEIIYRLFIEVMSGLISGKSFPQSDEHWTRKPYTRKQLNELCIVDPGMDRKEIKRRLRATTYGNRVWATVRINGLDMPYEEAVERNLI